MMKRYKLFSENGVKELSAYNALADQAQPDENGEKMKNCPRWWWSSTSWPT